MTKNVFGFLHRLINNTLGTVYLYRVVSFLAKLMNIPVPSSQVKVPKLNLR